MSQNPSWLRKIAWPAAVLALAFAIFSARALWGLRGARGVVCMALSHHEPLVAQVGRLERCEQNADGTWAVSGAQGSARVTATVHGTGWDSTVDDISFVPVK